MKKKIISFVCLGLALLTASAQETPNIEQRVETIEKAIGKLQKLKVSGYIQTQYQWGEQDALLKEKGVNETKGEESFDRFGVRRGRIKFAYEDGIASGVFQLDITENGVGLKDAYMQVKDPFFSTGSSLKAGIFDRPFGYEISYSSSRRESPERSTVFQTLFPDERDLGAMLTLQAGKNSPLNFLKLEAGLFSGNGIKQETDSRKDFIGHLSVNRNLNSNITFGGGFSYYNGSVFQGDRNIFTMKEKGFTLNDDAANVGEYAKREYFGMDLQFAAKTELGETKLTAEYLFGQQPGQESASKSPNGVLPAYPTYIRNFNGGYVMLVQDLGKLPLSAVLKYDFYDPNTKISGNEAGLNDTGKADLAQNTFGFGLLWHATAAIRLTGYYEVNSNETSENVQFFEKDRKDNVFTLRLQYKF